LLVISIDALVFEDIEHFKKQPVFKEFFQGSSMVERMRTIYPTMTYPAHVSILTGTYPNKHGIIHNEKFLFKEGPTVWQWYADAIKVPTLMDYSKEAGYTTGNVNWPVTAGAKSIDYNIPEIWPLNKEDDPRPLFLKAGSAPIIKTVFDKNKEKWDWKNHPGYEVFATGCAVDIIKTYKPEVMLIHLSEVDHSRHANGVFSNYVKRAIELTDKWLGELFTALKEAGVYDDTNIVILGDHGQMDVHKVCHLNVLFVKAGLIKVHDKNVVSYDAYAKSCGLSAHIFLKDPFDKSMEAKVYSLLKEWQKKPEYGIGEIFFREEVNEKYHLNGDFSFVIETDGCTSFGNHVDGEEVSATRNDDYKFGRATHGYLPFKGPQPTFIAKGPDFRRGVVIPNANTVDEAPTLAKLLGFEMKNVDGRVLNELLI